MDYIAIAFLTLAPLKLGIYALLDYVGILIKNKNFRIIINSLKIITNLIYLGFFFYIFRELGKGKKFEYNRTVRMALSMITFFLIMVVLILAFGVVGGGKGSDVEVEGISDETMDKIELVIYFVFVGYLIYRLSTSVVKFVNKEYVKEVDQKDIYKWVILAIVVIILSIIRLYFIVNKKEVTTTAQKRIADR